MIVWYIFTVNLLFIYLYIISLYHYKHSYRRDGKTVALILARGGSKGIKLKNLSKINNETLIARTISVIKKSKKFKDIWVSTDHEEIKVEAEIHGALVHNRAPYTATDTASSLIAVLEFLQAHPDVGVLGLVQATSPFLKAETLAHAVDMMSTGIYNSVFSVTRQYKLRWTNHSGEFIAANFNPENRPRRQDWNGELIENGMFYLAKARKITITKSLQPPRNGVIEVPSKDSHEIDTPLDLKIAQFLIEDGLT